MKNRALEDLILDLEEFLNQKRTEVFDRAKTLKGSKDKQDIDKCLVMLDFYRFINIVQRKVFKIQYDLEDDEQIKAMLLSMSEHGMETNITGLNLENALVEAKKED